ncbi:MAG: hypothetical protein ABS939_19785 [Psychrobacillus sp.]|uniref:hypothetical protein n=1 Tax=Psychrobacillus sp. FSL K6-4046 TaxID=2921550 RepID=UPI00315AFA02
MTKDKWKAFVNLGVLFSVMGLILNFSSVYFGVSLADQWLSNEGSADTSLYLSRVTGYTNSFLATGSVFLMIGLLMIIISTVKVLDSRE